MSARPLVSEPARPVGIRPPDGIWFSPPECASARPRTSRPMNKRQGDTARVHDALRLSVDVLLAEAAIRASTGNNSLRGWSGAKAGWSEMRRCLWPFVPRPHAETVNGSLSDLLRFQDVASTAMHSWNQLPQAQVLEQPCQSTQSGCADRKPSGPARSASGASNFGRKEGGPPSSSQSWWWQIHGCGGQSSAVEQAF
jgi:hypothetical protein